MRDMYLMQPSVTRNPDELIKAIGKRRRRQLAWAVWSACWPLLLGVVVLAVLCGFLLSEAGQAFLMGDWMEGL